MAKEHLGVALALKVPAFFVVTKASARPALALSSRAPLDFCSPGAGALYSPAPGPLFARTCACVRPPQGLCSPAPRPLLKISLS